MARKQHETKLPPPFLKRAWLPHPDDLPDQDWSKYPLSMPLIRNAGIDLVFSKAVTIIVGENGSGKSTLLEAIAHMAGFSELGGAQGMFAVQSSDVSGADGGAIGDLLRSSWLPQVKRG